MRAGHRVEESLNAKKFIAFTFVTMISIIEIGLFIKSQEPNYLQIYNVS